MNKSSLPGWRKICYIICNIRRFFSCIQVKGDGRCGRLSNCRPLLGAVRAGHCGDRRQIRRLLPGDRPPHPLRPGGRGGVRQRHLAPGLERHAAPPSRPAGYLSGQDHPQPVPGPLEAGRRPEAGPGPGGAGPGGAGRMYPRGQQRGGRPGRQGPGGEPRPFSGGSPAGETGAVRPAVLVPLLRKGHRRPVRGAGAHAASTLSRLRRQLRTHLEKEGFTV